MRKPLLVIIFLMSLCTWSFAQSNGQMLAYADGSALSSHKVTPDDLFGGDQDDASVIFYPNPVKTTLNVKFPDKGNYTVRIYNIVGEKITEKSVYDDDIVRLNLGDLVNGMYFLSYDFNGKVVTKTFSKTQ